MSETVEWSGQLPVLRIGDIGLRAPSRRAGRGRCIVKLTLEVDRFMGGGGRSLEDARIMAHVIS